jgi:hypothetical protein
MTDKDSIKEQADIVKVIREYVRLRKVGQRYIGICPFHHEKTPSLSVSGRDQFFKCFGCDAKGDVFNFIMQIEGVSFPAAVRSVAERYGLVYERSTFLRRVMDRGDRQCCAWWWQKRLAAMRTELALAVEEAAPPPIRIERHDDGSATVQVLGPMPASYEWANCLGRMIRRAERLSMAEQLALFTSQVTTEDRRAFQAYRVHTQDLEKRVQEFCMNTVDAMEAA